MSDLKALRTFVRESNKIERIIRAPLLREMRAHERFLRLQHVAISDLEAFVETVAPGHLLRSHPGLNVRVGNHIAPPGGPEVMMTLSAILHFAGAFGDRPASPWVVHKAYETLHPFTDGNGRSGRVLWLWMMLRHEGQWSWMIHDGGLRIGFLHAWYYQTLAESRP